MRTILTRVGAAAIAFVALTTSCSDQTNSATQPAPNDPNRIIICGEGCGGGGNQPPSGPPAPPPPPFRITANSMNGHTVLGIGGNGVPYTLSVMNNGPSISGVTVQAYLEQGTTVKRAAGGTLINCGQAPGVLPAGTCNTTANLVALQTGSGVGTLQPGHTFVDISVSVGVSKATTGLSVDLIPLNFAVLPQLNASRLAGQLPRLDWFTQGGVTVTGLSFQTVVTQFGILRALPASPLRCLNEPEGVFAAFHSCSSNGGVVPAGMIAGPATLTTKLMHAGLALYSVSQPLQLDDVKATSLTLPPGLAINGAVVPITVAVVNNGPNIAAGLVARVAAEQNGFVRSYIIPIKCAETPSRDGMAPGPCTVNTFWHASGGPGGLVPGPVNMSVAVRTIDGAGLDSIARPGIFTATP